jgi:hypothetical protein
VKCGDLTSKNGDIMLMFYLNVFGKNNGMDIMGRSWEYSGNSHEKIGNVTKKNEGTLGSIEILTLTPFDMI